MLPSRAARRDFARKLGLVKKTSNLKKMDEHLEKTIKMGQMIHSQHLQDLHNIQLKERMEKEGSE